MSNSTDCSCVYERQVSSPSGEQSTTRERVAKLLLPEPWNRPRNVGAARGTLEPPAECRSRPRNAGADLGIMEPPAACRSRPQHAGAACGIMEPPAACQSRLRNHITQEYCRVGVSVDNHKRPIILLSKSQLCDQTLKGSRHPKTYLRLSSVASF